MDRVLGILHSDEGITLCIRSAMTLSLGISRSTNYIAPIILALTSYGHSDISETMYVRMSMSYQGQAYSVQTYIELSLLKFNKCLQH